MNSLSENSRPFVRQEYVDFGRELKARNGLTSTSSWQARGQAFSNFSKENIAAVFKILDVAGTGAITFAQYQEGDFFNVGATMTLTQWINGRHENAWDR
jgi:hypothetical protein